MDVSPDELPSLYSWVDGIPLSRPKRNIARDFSDGVLAAEMVAHYCPRLVDIHNYSAANGLAQKIYNWNTLNNKIFRRLNFTLTKEDIEAVASSEPQVIERILKLLKYKIARYRPNSVKVQEPLRDDGADGFNAGFRCRYHSRKSPPRLSTPCTQFPQETSTCVNPRKSMQDSSTEKLPEESPREYQKDAQIRELRETIELLEAKLAKLEQLVRLKDHKIHVLSGKPTRQAYGK